MRRKNARKCRGSIMDLPHVSVRLMIVVSNVDNDDVDGDNVTGNNEEVIT